MPEEKTQNSIAASKFLGADKNGKPNLKISQEKAYQILSEGVVFTMEDDLKEAMSQQRMKADLIPGQAKPIGKPEKFQPEKPYFDPFKNLSPEGPPATTIKPAEKPAPAPVSMVRGPVEPSVAPLHGIEEKPLPFKKVDVLDRAEQAQEERLAKEKFSPITPEQEIVQRAVAEKAKIEEQRKEREAVENIRQEAREQKEEELALKQPKGPEFIAKEIEAKAKQVIQKSPEPTAKPPSSPISSAPFPPLLTGKDWLKNIPSQNLPKIKQELSKKVLDILAELKKLSLEERPFSEKRARLSAKLKEKNLVLDKVLAHTQTAKERQRQIESLEAKAQDSSQKHTLEQQRWRIEEILKQTEED